uniref:Pecanex-like protein n=1 Tax=Gongylonema pulchrum TaxID=637853 RepID=A0A183D462_9BILA
LVSAGGEDGVVAATNAQKMLLSRSSLDERSLLLGSPLLDSSQSVKRAAKSKMLNGRTWRKRCRSEMSDTEDAPTSPSLRSADSSSS